MAALALLVFAPELASAQAANQSAQGAAATTTDQAIEVYLSENAMQAMYVRNIDFDETGPIEARAGFFYNEVRDLIAIGDLLAPLGNMDNPGRFDLRFGSRVYAAFLAEENQDIFGISVGVEAEYFFDRARTMSAMIGMFYAPDIITFGAADNVKDFVARVGTRLRGGTNVFVGYRNFEIDTLVDREVDDNLHVGVEYRF